MFIKVEIDWEYIRKNSWSGALDTVLEIERQGREEEAWEVIVSYMDAAAVGCDLPTEMDVNDFIWFELVDIMNLYGDSDEEK